MIAGRSAEILRQLENTAANDRELLARFVRERDQSAFAELVRRHAPVVLGVCRRVTGHQQDAEDAFQVVFLILARKATAIGNPDLLGNWLYGVAVRVAQTVRRSVVRRRTREIAVNTIPEPPSSPVTTHSELNPILDEELAALPSWYGDAIVLCDLRGVSREEAAAALGVPEGTLSSRLANGRKKLAIRLTKRGIALSAAAIPTALSAAQAVVPTDLLAKTSVLVADWIAGGTIPKPLALFTEGGFTMRKMLVLGLFTAAVAVAGVLYATQPAPGPPTTDPLKTVTAVKPEVAEEPVPDAKPGDKPVAFTSTPRLHNRLNMNLHGNLTVLWNPQGNQLAVAGMQWEPHEGGGVNNTKERLAIQTVTFDPLKEKFALPAENVQLVGFTPDGKHFLTELREYQLVSGFHKLELWGEATVRPDARSAWPVVVRAVELDPTETQGYAFATDGKTFRTVAIERNPNKREIVKLHVLEMDGTTGKRLRSLLTVNASTYAMSSDGKRFAAIETTGKENIVNVYDVGRGTKLCSFALPPGWDITVMKSSGGFPARPGISTIAWMSSSLTFSPDGHRLLICRGMNDTAAYQTTRFETQLSPIAGVIGWTVVLDVDTGKRLPALEGANHYIDKDKYVDRGYYIDTLPTPQPFTADGRLLALSGTRYVVKTQTHGVLGSNELGTHVWLESPRQFLTVWDTDTGKVLKTWDLSAKIALNPVRPVLAILEPNGDNTRLGLWDFSAEDAEKK